MNASVGSRWFFAWQARRQAKQPTHFFVLISIP